jgi:hypothetical protein
MKISEFLKTQGVFSNDIKNRFKTNQIKINGEIIKDDINLDVVFTHNNPMFITNVNYDAGNWIFNNLILKLSESKKKQLFNIINLFDIETLFSGDCKLNNIPVEEILPELNILKNYIFLKISKKQSFVFKKI